MEPTDRLDALLRRFGVQAQQFFDGNLCDRRRFEPLPGRGFLHILRAGSMAVDDGAGTGRWLSEPTLLFYPRAHDHTFTPGAGRGVDLACATLAFEGGASHPLVAALIRAYDSRDRARFERKEAEDREREAREADEPEKQS